MPSIALDGAALAKTAEIQLSRQVMALKAKTDMTPKLATVLVGDDPASATYVKMKGNACRRVGMLSDQIHLPHTTTTESLIECINTLNNDPETHGILLQHPVPDQINERACFDAIALEKDIDGVTSAGFGAMSMGERAHGSATPTAIMRLLTHYDISLQGRHCVVIGRSAILGKPMAMMMLNANATVTICHSHTENLSDIVANADIVVAALAKPAFVKGEWIKSGAVVIDAGYHPGQIGDVDLASVIPKCRAYTPVPGGVGPMTINTVITQTLTAFMMQKQLEF